jgi:hypothetical protein
MDILIVVLGGEAIFGAVAAGDVRPGLIDLRPRVERPAIYFIKAFHLRIAFEGAAGAGDEIGVGDVREITYWFRDGGDAAGAQWDLRQG